MQYTYRKDLLDRKSLKISVVGIRFTDHIYRERESEKCTFVLCEYYIKKGLLYTTIILQHSVRSRPSTDIKKPIFDMKIHVYIGSVNTKDILKNVF